MDKSNKDTCKKTPSEAGKLLKKALSAEIPAKWHRKPVKMNSSEIYRRAGLYGARVRRVMSGKTQKISIDVAEKLYKELRSFSSEALGYMCGEETLAQVVEQFAKASGITLGKNGDIDENFVSKVTKSEQNKTGRSVSPQQ